LNIGFSKSKIRETTISRKWMVLGIVPLHSKNGSFPIESLDATHEKYIGLPMNFNLMLDFF
jgi:hypothetical protein